MTASDLEDFLSTAITDYANEKVEAGTWDEEEALAKSQDSFNKLLYDGLLHQMNISTALSQAKKSVIFGSMWTKLALVNMLSFMIL